MEHSFAWLHRPPEGHPESERITIDFRMALVLMKHQHEMEDWRALSAAKKVKALAEDPR